MKLNYFLPTHIHFDTDCLQKNSAVFSSYGNKAAIITGRHSAKSCGALDDVTTILDAHHIAYEVYNQVENNPSVETVREIAEKAKAFGAAFIIGIGGGSPLDASKAVAVLCANETLDALDLFLNNFDTKLPLIAIPTTAGTGSEATQYSVLLRKDLETKVSFGNQHTYPTVALIDPKYTYYLKLSTTITTAVDAFTHVLEGYLGKRSNPLSDSMALVGFQCFGSCLPHLLTDQLTCEDREQLMMLSLLGGLVISQAGVTSPHGMGYCYTYFKDIPHGQANGFLLREYLKLNYPQVPEKIDTVMHLMGMKNIDEFSAQLEQLIGKPPVLTTDEIEKFTELSMLQKGSLGNSPTDMTIDVVKDLWIRQNQ